jgi:hypothetical protein
VGSARFFGHPPSLDDDNAAVKLMNLMTFVNARLCSFSFALHFLLQLLYASSERAIHDSKWEEYSSGVQLVFDLDVKKSMVFVDGDGPSDQIFIDGDSGQIHADFLPNFLHPQMLLYTAVRNDLFNQGHAAWVPIINSQVASIHYDPVSSKQYQMCWYSTNATTQLLQSGGVHYDLKEESEASLIGCYDFAVDFVYLFGVSQPVYQPMLKHECLQKYALVDICNTHTIVIWTLDTIADDVASIVPQRSSFIKLHIGRIYRIELKVTFEFLQDDASILTVEKDASYLVVFRNKINFVYLVQHDAFCNASHLRHSDAEVLVVQWKEEHDCFGCFFFPNSTVNEGRNELWRRTFQRWPGTVFTYYIFLDGDATLTLRPHRNKLSPSPNASEESLPFRVFEQHLLHYRPAVAVPFYSQWHFDNGSDVQFVSNFDHVLLAVHAHVSRMFLPTETIFDHKSWWWAQRVWGFLCSVAFPQQTLQINAVMSDNGSVKMQSGVCGVRDRSFASFNGAEQANPQIAPSNTKKYMRSNRFELAFLWFIASLKRHKSSEILRDIQTDLISPEPSSRAMKQPVKSNGKFEMANLGEFSKSFDFLHPYWLNRKFLLIENRTFTGYLSPCAFFSDVGLTSKESCLNTNDVFDIALFQADVITSLINNNQMLLNQNHEIIRRIEALEKHSQK